MVIICGLLMAACSQTVDGQDATLLRRFRGDFVAIRPGEPPFPATFRMGRPESNAVDARPTKKRLQSFEIAKYELTQDVWERVMGANPSRWRGTRNSVERVSFDDANEFCRRVTKSLRSMNLLEREQVVALPSEVEWEYATRASSDSDYSFGDDPAQLGQYAWFQGNAAGNDPPVGVKRPNPWGLYDLHGYLWEWCSSVSSNEDAGGPIRDALRPQVPAGHRVLRGGSWKDSAEDLTSFNRRVVDRDFKDDAVGLRCVIRPAVGRNPTSSQSSTSIEGRP